MKPAIPLTPIQTWFRSILFQVFVVGFAINSEATPNDTHRVMPAASKTSSLCSTLLSADLTRAKVGSGAERFLVLAKMGLQLLLTERHDLVAALSVATQSEYPVNPFLNLTSYQAKALSQETEPIIAKMEQDDWRWIQRQLFPLLQGKQAEADSRQHSVRHTSQVESFQFVSNDQINQALGGETNWFKNGNGSRMYLGTAGEIHIFRIQRLIGSEVDFGIVGISERHTKDTPGIISIISYKTFGGMAKANSELADVDRKKIWVLDGKLYVVIPNSKGGSEVLAQIDPSTGSILHRYQVPDQGRIRIWDLGQGRIIAASFSGLWSLVRRAEAKRFYRFDPKEEAFVATGLDVGFLHSRKISVVEDSYGSLLRIDEYGHYLSDGEFLYFWTDEGRLQKKDSAYGLAATVADSKRWSDMLRASIGAYDSDNDIRYIKISVFGDVTKLGPGGLVIPPKPFVQGRQIELDVPTEGHGLEERFRMSLFGIPGTNMNVVYASIASEHAAGWLIDRDSLEVRILPVPTDLSDPDPRTKECRRGKFEINHFNSSLGQHVLSAIDGAAGTFSTWVLNPDTFEFGEPQVTNLPSPRANAAVIVGADGRLLVGQFVGDGIWVRQRVRLSR